MQLTLKVKLRAGNPCPQLNKTGPDEHFLTNFQVPLGSFLFGKGSEWANTSNFLDFERVIWADFLDLERVNILNVITFFDKLVKHLS